MLVDYSFIRFDVRFCMDMLWKGVGDVSPDLVHCRYGPQGTRCSKQSWSTGFCYSGSAKKRTFLRPNDPECRAAFPESDRTIGDSI